VQNLVARAINHTHPAFSNLRHDAVVAKQVTEHTIRPRQQAYSTAASAVNRRSRVQNSLSAFRDTRPGVILFFFLLTEG
jgi:hypothetical protein